MDLSMPEMDGLEATRLIKAERPEQVVVILTASEAESDLFEAIKFGAQGYLLKNLEPEQLIGQLEAAARGEAAPPAGSTSGPDQSSARPYRRGESPRSPAPDEVEPLTARERDVLGLVVRGASNREIAEVLVVTDNTVKYHLKNILEKL